MAYLAMRGCCHATGVAQLHGRVSRTLFHILFPGCPAAEVPIGHVTNGVHVPTWPSEPANKLWGQAYGADGPWLGNLGAAADAVQQLSDEDLWDYRADARKMLVDYVRQRLERQRRERNVSRAIIQEARHVLDPNVLTLGFARRFAEYKRPNLLLSDRERFARILRDPERPVQCVVHVCVPMQCQERLHGTVNGHVYRAVAPAQRPAGHFTPRIVPHHREAFIPMETTRATWHSSR